MEIGPAAVRSNEIQKRETWSAENAATLAALDLETVSARLYPQVPTGTNVVVANVTTVQGEEMASGVGSLPMAVVASGSGLSRIPMVATIVVLATAENTQTNAQRRTTDESDDPTTCARNHMYSVPTPYAPDPTRILALVRFLFSGINHIHVYYILAAALCTKAYQTLYPTEERAGQMTRPQGVTSRSSRERVEAVESVAIRTLSHSLTYSIESVRLCWRLLALR